jgi:hypothetical protein
MSQDTVSGKVIEPGLEGLVPSMNVGVPAKQEPENSKEIVSDEMVLGLYAEILNTIKQDRTEIDDVLVKFMDMVLNEGDSTTSSKEALVNLIKMKTDQADKMSKVADMMTRVKLKEKDTFPRYLAASQNNTINIGDGGQKRALLEAIDKARKEKK